jgi:hypothetical protein
MKLLCPVAAAMAIAAFVAGPARAQAPQQTLGSTLIKFPIPAGQCEVSDRTPPGAAFSKLMREAHAGSGETILLIHTDCAQFERFGRGGGATLDDYAIYIVTGIARDKVYTPDFMRRACAASRTLKSPDGTTLDDFALSGINISETRQLGVLLEDKDACYTGMVARVTTPTGIDGVHLGVFANVLVNGKLIAYRFYGPFHSSQDVTESLDRHKANVAAFISANTQ